LKQRLDMGVELAEPLPEKPKGMWARTYGCLLDEILQAEILANEVQANKMKRILERVEDDLE
jgi:hypothetical protein